VINQLIMNSMIFSLFFFF